MAGLTVDAAHMIGIFIGLLLFGFYLALFLASVYQLRQRARDSKIVFTALVSLFLLSGGYYVLAAFDVYKAFVLVRETEGVLAYLNEYGDAIASTKDFLYVCSIPVADGLLAWRLFVIWPANRIALAAVAALGLGLLVSGFFISILEIRQCIVGDDRYVQRIYQWTIIASALIIVNNLVMTGCIAFRLWWMGRQVAILGQRAQSLYKRIIFILIQSGSMYLSIMVFQIVLYAFGIRSAIYLFLHISPAIVAIFPTAIVLQLNLQSTRRTTHIGGNGAGGGVGVGAGGATRASLSNWAVAWPKQDDSNGTDVSGGSNTVTGLDSTYPAFERRLRIDVGATHKTEDGDLDLEVGMVSEKSPSPAKALPTIKFMAPRSSPPASINGPAPSPISRIPSKTSSPI